MGVVLIVLLLLLLLLMTKIILIQDETILSQTIFQSHPFLFNIVNYPSIFIVCSIYGSSRHYYVRKFLVGTIDANSLLVVNDLNECDYCKNQGMPCKCHIVCFNLWYGHIACGIAVGDIVSDGEYCVEHHIIKHCSVHR